MASAAEIKGIELKRLAELEKQRAYHGIDTPPEVLIEISELRSKYGAAATAVSREAGPDLGGMSVRDLIDELDFVRTVCASALRRITVVEQNQLWRNVWLLLLTIGIVAVLIRVY